MSEEMMHGSCAHGTGLRRELRRKRAAIPRRQRERAACLAWQQLRRWPLLQRSRRVAAYIAMPGEFPTDKVIAGLHRQGREVYLPVIHFDRVRNMVFRRYFPGQKLRLNRYGIPEPVGNARNDIPARQLDLVLVPLLGFDHCGSRLGMGGGYYDTHFAFRLECWRLRKPWLLGLAFEVQHCEEIERNSWDVPLDAVLTERRLSIVR